MAKPALFIGSSSEGLDFARAVRSLLAQDAEVTLWNEGFFLVGDTFIESLVKSLSRFDFAAVVLTPDDLVTSRDHTILSPRDNALFELGLFMGRLGRERTFVVRPQGDSIKIPSDLAGLTTAPYDWPRGDGNHMAAVGAACDSIRERIRALGFSEARVTTQVRAVQDEQARQRADIDGILEVSASEFRDGVRADASEETGICLNHFSSTGRTRSRRNCADCCRLDSLRDGQVEASARCLPRATTSTTIWRSRSEARSYLAYSRQVEETAPERPDDG